MAENDDKINEQFKLQSQHVFKTSSSKSDELSANMNNYASATNNKMLPYSKCCSLRKNRIFNNFTYWK